MNSIITAPSDALHVQQIPELDNKLPENCIFNKGKTGCGATTLAIENRISTLIAVPTVNLIKNKLPEHADLLGVYGGVSNQEIYNRQNQMRRNSEPDATFRGLS
ncbi:hypothetical protein [Alistipes sp.]|uniref:hypothetical protein n=1 Tax=Alistipes sp. TaxID=1872444 RepID=UPI0023F40FCE|nr:hypothetical protein [Alistipes sp.]